MAQNVKKAKIEQFLLKNSLHKILNIYTDVGTYVFLSRPRPEKKLRTKIIINIHFLQFSFLRLKLK